MKIKRNVCGVLLSLGLVIAPGLAWGGQSGSTTIDPAKTGNSENEVTRKIKQDLSRNKSLSSHARRLQVMAVGDRVMLRGPVRSESERKTVLACAKKHAGENNVVDQTILAK
jgi:hyperosmotically inducible periplasmic protein